MVSDRTNKHLRKYCRAGRQAARCFLDKDGQLVLLIGCLCSFNLFFIQLQISVYLSLSIVRLNYHYVVTHHYSV